MKKILLAAIVAASATITVPANAAKCEPGEQLVRVTVATGGAINNDVFSTLSYLLDREPYSSLANRHALELKKLLAEHVVQPLAAGRVLCADNLTRWNYAKQVRLQEEGFAVLVREKDVVVIK